MKAQPPVAPLLTSAQRRSARRREAWWQAKLDSVSADTEASHTRSTAMVDEMRGLLHEMQYAVPVPGKSPGAALIGATTQGSTAVAGTDTPAEPAAVPAMGSLQTAPEANHPGGNSTPAQAQAMDVSPPISPPSSPPCAVGRREEVLLREASEALALRRECAAAQWGC